MNVLTSGFYTGRVRVGGWGGGGGGGALGFPPRSLMS